jgi:hypothetical protein
MSKTTEISIAPPLRPLPDKCWYDAKNHACSPHNTNPNYAALRQFVRGLYDLQALRIATGNRLCAQVRTRLGQSPGLPEDTTLSPDVIKLLKDIKEQHKLRCREGDQRVDR